VIIVDIHLQQFRSHHDSSFEFGEGVNIVVGPNGSGKTNLLEAILVVARGGSFRVGDKDLVEFNQPWMRLEAHMSDGSERIVKLTTLPPQKSYEINSKTYMRPRHEQLLPSVLFEPNHLMLFHGSPEGRRNYLDEILEQTKPGYKSFRKNYRRVLAQRNALLKMGQHSRQDFFPWDLRLSELGAVMSRARYQLVEELNQTITDLYTELSHSQDSVALAYATQFSIESYESQLMSRLEQTLPQDQQRGFTSYGPHRDDLTTLFNAQPIELVASRGEVRTLTLALKVLELQTIEAATNKRPLLFLDDVFSELDGVRRKALTNYLQKYQTFLTTTDADMVVKHFTTSTILPLNSSG